MSFICYRFFFSKENVEQKKNKLETGFVCMPGRLTQDTGSKMKSQAQNGGIGLLALHLHTKEKGGLSGFHDWKGGSS